MKTRNETTGEFNHGALLRTTSGKMNQGIVTEQDNR